METSVVYDPNRELKVVSYTIEIWNWHTGKYIADISKILTSELEIEWVLDDVESVSFSIDLVQFKKMCQLMGVEPQEVLTPYVHDIRIRRNGQYILGAQVVETNIQINNDSPSTIEIRATGFLNLFKDQYITEAWSGYTYAQIARKLVQGAQRPENLTRNPTADIDASYWLCQSGSLAWTNNSTYVHSGVGAIRTTRASSGWVVAGTQINVPKGTKVYIDVWVKGANGQAINFKQRSLESVVDGQTLIGSITGNGAWQHYTKYYTTNWNNEYIHIEQNNSTSIAIDDCYIYLRDEQEKALSNLNVNLGFDTASASQNDERQVDYQLQNIKDALINLTCMEDDNFDFSFAPDRTFNCYGRKGSDKLDIEALYPGNIHSMKITRSASNLSNKIINIGSGIGDERLQVTTSDIISRQTYGTRESVVTRNNVQLTDTLCAQGMGDLRDRKDPTNLPKVTIRDGSINPSNIEVGDCIIVKVEGDEYLGTINGLYRVVQFEISVDLEAVETVNLTLEPTGYVF